LSLRASPLVIARAFSEAIFFIMPDSIKVIVMDKLYSVYIMTNKNNKRSSPYWVSKNERKKSCDPQLEGVFSLF
jgi:hypothetical protein